MHCVLSINLQTNFTHSEVDHDYAPGIDHVTQPHWFGRDHQVHYDKETVHNIEEKVAIGVSVGSGPVAHKLLLKIRKHIFQLLPLVD